jgi:hypothetical protein
MQNCNTNGGDTGKVAGYDLHDPGSILGNREEIFPLLHRCGQTCFSPPPQATVQWAPSALSSVVNLPKREADHLSSLVTVYQLLKF